MKTPLRLREVSWRRKVWYAFDAAWLAFELYTLVMSKREPHKPDDTFSATHRDAWRLTTPLSKVLFAVFLGWLQAHAYKENRPILVIVPDLGSADELESSVQ